MIYLDLHSVFFFFSQQTILLKVIRFVFLEGMYYCEGMSCSFHILIFLQIDEENHSVGVAFKVLCIAHTLSKI